MSKLNCLIGCFIYSLCGYTMYGAMNIVCKFLLYSRLTVNRSLSCEAHRSTVHARAHLARCATNARAISWRYTDSRQAGKPNGKFIKCTQQWHPTCGISVCWHKVVVHECQFCQASLATPHIFAVCQEWCHTECARAFGPRAEDGGCGMRQAREPEKYGQTYVIMCHVFVIVSIIVHSRIMRACACVLFMLCMAGSARR